MRVSSWIPLIDENNPTVMHNIMHESREVERMHTLEAIKEDAKDIKHRLAETWIRFLDKLHLLHCKCGLPVPLEQALYWQHVQVWGLLCMPCAVSFCTGIKIDFIWEQGNWRQSLDDYEISRRLEYHQFDHCQGYPSPECDECANQNICIPE